MDKPVQVIGIGTAFILFILLNRITTNALLQKTFYVPDLFTNLISLNILLKKRYSFDTRSFYIYNKSNWTETYILLQDNLFPIKVAYKKGK